MQNCMIKYCSREIYMNAKRFHLQKDIQNPEQISHNLTACCCGLTWQLTQMGSQYFYTTSVCHTPGVIYIWLTYLSCYTTLHELLTVIFFSEFIAIHADWTITPAVSAFTCIHIQITMTLHLWLKPYIHHPFPMQMYSQLSRHPMCRRAAC